MRILILLPLYLGVGFGESLLAQELLANPSFEDEPHAAKSPRGWYDCGEPGESPIDVHSDTTEFFGVREVPVEGETFVGMVVRSNGTRERLSQRIPANFYPDVEYEFSIYLSYTLDYWSLVRNPGTGEYDVGQPVSFGEPAALSLSLGNAYCNESQVIKVWPAETAGAFQEVSVRFSPDTVYSYILLQAEYSNDFDEDAYNGNILIDAASLAVVEAEGEVRD